MEILAINKLLREHFEEYEKNHKIQPHLIQACRKMMKCRTEELGGSLYECPNGDYEKIVYNSCKHRACPSCNLINIENWLRRTQDNLIKTNHYHVIYTIPEELNSLFQLNREEFTNILFKASYESINKLMKGEYNVTAGAISTLHTWARNLTLHPHIHMLITAGGMENETKKWKSSRDEWLVSVKALGVIFRGKLLDEIHKRVYDDKMVLEKGFNRYRTHALLKELREKNWNVYVTDKYDHAQGVATYLARYVKGGAISNRRILSYDKEEVSFYYYENNESKEKKIMNLKTDEFIRRLLLHIPNPRQVTVRRYGLYANYRSENLKRIRREIAGNDDKTQERKPLKALEYLKENKLYEANCKCPYCKTELVLRGKYTREEIIKIKIFPREEIQRENQYHKKKA
jgi:hypothetical protein